MDKLTALLTAIDEILDDDHVTAIQQGSRIAYRVTRDDGIAMIVHELERGNADYRWAAFYDGSRFDEPRPFEGLPGSRTARPQQAVAWALLD